MKLKVLLIILRDILNSFQDDRMKLALIRECVKAFSLT